MKAPPVVHRWRCPVCHKPEKLVLACVGESPGRQSVAIPTCACDRSQVRVTPEWRTTEPHAALVEAVRRVVLGEPILLEGSQEPCDTLEALFEAWGDLTQPRAFQRNGKGEAAAAPEPAAPSSGVDPITDTAAEESTDNVSRRSVFDAEQEDGQNEEASPTIEGSGSTPAEYARTLDQWGLHVLPLCPKGKKPLGREWQKRPREENLRLFEANPSAGLGFIPGLTVNLITGSSVTLMHVDVDGSDAWRWFQEQVPAEVRNATVAWRSARGGYGFLFRLPPNSPLAKNTQIKVWQQNHSSDPERKAEAVELRVQRSNGVLPPTTVTIEGSDRSYTWLEGAKRFEDFAGPEEIPLLPESLHTGGVQQSGGERKDPKDKPTPPRDPLSGEYLDAVRTVADCIEKIPSEAVWSYEGATEIGMMIHSALPDNTGFGLWDSLCRKADERYAEDTTWTRKKWKSFHPKGNSTGQLTLASLVAKARECQSRTAARVLEPGETAPSGSVDWEEPVPIVLDDVVVPFPIEALPPQMRRLVESVAASLEVPVDFPATLLLGAVAGAAQRTYCVRVTRDYREPLCLFLIMAAASGERKTPAARVFREPYDKAQAILRERVRPVIAKAEFALSQLEDEKKRFLADIGGITREANKLIFAESEEDVQRRDKLLERKERLRERAAELSVNIKERTIPPEPLLWLTEATPESIAKVLSDLQSLVVFASEGDLIDVVAGQYTDKTGKLGILLSAYSMDTHTEGRMDGNREAVEPRLTIILAVQHAVVEKLQGVKDFRERGLTPRFLYATPTSRVGCRAWNLDSDIDSEARSTYERIIGNLLGVELNVGSLKASDVDLSDLMGEGTEQGAAEENKGPLPPQQELRLTPEALMRFQEYARSLEPQLVAEEADLSGFVTWGSKLPGQMLRLAGVLHLLAHGEIGDQSPCEAPIEAGTVDRAIAIADYFKAHTLRLFVQRPHTREQVVLEWVVENGKAEFSARDVYRSRRRRFNEEMSQLNTTLANLEQLGWIARKLQGSAGPGRPSMRYLVNPCLWKSNWVRSGSDRDKDRTSGEEDAPPPSRDEANATIAEG